MSNINVPKHNGTTPARAGWSTEITLPNTPSDLDNLIDCFKESRAGKPYLAKARGIVLEVCLAANDLAEQKSDQSAERLMTVTRLRLEGMSLEQIAEGYGCTRQAIHASLKPLMKNLSPLAKEAFSHSNVIEPQQRQIAQMLIGNMSIEEVAATSGIRVAAVSKAAGKLSMMEDPEIRQIGEVALGAHESVQHARKLGETARRAEERDARMNEMIRLRVEGNFSQPQIANRVGVATITVHSYLKLAAKRYPEKATAITRKRYGPETRPLPESLAELKRTRLATILALIKDGVSIAGIRARTGMARSTINNYINELQHSPDPEVRLAAQARVRQERRIYKRFLANLEASYKIWKDGGSVECIAENVKISANRANTYLRWFQGHQVPTKVSAALATIKARLGETSASLTNLNADQAPYAPSLPEPQE